MDSLKSVVIPAVAWLVMTGHAECSQLPPRVRGWVSVVLLMIAAIGSIRLGHQAISNSLHPPEWDFALFWMNGSLASRGLNFYDPILTAQVASSLPLHAGFVREAAATPFLYPPPSIAWFVPLGWFRFPAAAVSWYSAQLVCLAMAILVLSFSFFKGNGMMNVPFVTILILMIHGTDWNVEHGQTLFLLLLFVSLALRYRNAVWGGVWLALAVLVKPLIAMILLYPIVKRKWQPLAGTLATLFVATAGTLVFFGQDVFRSYAAIRFQSLPLGSFTELENQSISAWMMRVNHSNGPFQPWFWVVAVLLVALLVWTLSKTRGESEAVAFALCLVTALLLYPASLRSYTVLLIVPILVLCKTRSYALAIALAYGLMFVGDGNYVILATAIIGIALIVRMKEVLSIPFQPGVAAGS